VPTESASARPPTTISSRAWFALAVLAVTGQIAWAVENLWFNTFVYDELTPLIERGLAAAVYTQLTDVEIEFNGFLTYDRREPKMEEARIAAAHRCLCRRLSPLEPRKANP